MFIFLVFNFSGCALTSVEKPTVSASQSSGDDMLDQFADELEIEEVYDPFSGYNRVMTSFNDGAYEYVFKPVAKGYRAILHREIRLSIGNFFKNIYFPQRFVNNVFQGKFKYATEETGRFAINTTIGVLGLFDPAKSYFNLQEHKEDFGQTLGFYGVGSGPHIVLPFLGPSNLRDCISMYPDSLLSPIENTQRDWYTITDTLGEYISAKLLETTNSISLDINRYDEMKKDAIDLYPFLRDVYEQYRENQIKE